MNEVLDDQTEAKLLAEQLAQVRVLALAYLAKCLVDLFFRLQSSNVLLQGGYVLWVVLLVQVLIVQRCWYAFYSCQDLRLLLYGRLFYVGIGTWCLTLAGLYGGWENLVVPVRFLYALVILWLDAAVALLLVRYYYNKGQNTVYWLLMERLVIFTWVVVVLYRLTLHGYYEGYIEELSVSNLWISHQIFRGSFLVLTLLAGVYTATQIPHSDRILLWLSLLAFICWKLGLYFNYQNNTTVEALLFASIILAVFALASFAHKPLEDQEN